MPLTILDAVSLKGEGAQNEDACGAQGRVAWVLDGATGVCPLSIAFTIRSRPSGVSRAFLCMFIRAFLRGCLKLGNSSLHGLARMDNLWKDHI